MSFLDRRHQPPPDEPGDQPPTPPAVQNQDQPADQPADQSPGPPAQPGSGRGGGSRRRVRVGVIGIVAALLIGLLLAPGAANAAFVVPPVPTPPGPTPTAPGANPGTQAPPSGRAPNDTLPAPSSPEAPASGPAAARQAPGDALRALPFSTQPAAPNAVTCYLVVDKVTPTKPVSNVVGQGCHNGPRIPPLLNQLLPGGPGATSPPAPGTAPESTPAPSSAPAPVPRLRSDDGPNGVSAGAPDQAPAAAAQAASVPIAEFYAGTNYSGASFIIYGSGGGCDALGYRLSDIAARNSSIGGASSYRTYNNCSNQAIHNQVDFGGTANFFTGYNRASLPSGYNNNVRSARLASVPCTYYNETNASVCGLIRDKYNALGGPDGPLGFPTSNELTNPDGVGKRSTFQGATSIYWTPATGAHDVRGPLRDAWARNGWETGALGYPVSDQLGLVDNVGRTNRFFKNNTYTAGTPTRNTGAIYWSPATNARAVTGAIWDKYSALGGATSCHAYPTTDVVTDSKGPMSTFSGDPSRARVTPSKIGVRGGQSLSTCTNDGSMPEGGRWTMMTPMAAAATVPSRFASQPEEGTLVRPVPFNCPPGTTNYPSQARPDIPQPYSCIRVYSDNANAGHPVGLRQGRSGQTDEVLAPEEGPFGFLHADFDHNLSEQALGTVIANSGSGSLQDSGRYLYGAFFELLDTRLVSIEVREQREVSRQHPDGFAFGIVTAFCPIGADPGNQCPDGIDESMEFQYR